MSFCKTSQAWADLELDLVDFEFFVENLGPTRHGWKSVEKGIASIFSVLAVASAEMP